jgi:hypothetical protein
VNKGKKPQPPAVTVKSVNDAGGQRVHWLVRVDGLQLAAYGPDDSGHRAALRHRDRVLADWKAAQRRAA